MGHFPQQTVDLQDDIANNVGIAIINHPFLIVFYTTHLVITGIVYYCYTNIIQLLIAVIRRNFRCENLPSPLALSLKGSDAIRSMRENHCHMVVS